MIKIQLVSKAFYNKIIPQSTIRMKIDFIDSYLSDGCTEIINGYIEERKRLAGNSKPFHRSYKDQQGRDKSIKKLIFNTRPHVQLNPKTTMMIDKITDMVIFEESYLKEPGLHKLEPSDIESVKSLTKRRIFIKLLLNFAKKTTCNELGNQQDMKKFFELYPLTDGVVKILLEELLYV